MPGYKWKEKSPIKPVQELGGYVTVGRAAELLGVNASRIRQMINEEKMVAIALGDAAESSRPFFMIAQEEINRLRDKPVEQKKRGPQPGQGGRPKKVNTTVKDSSTWNIPDNAKTTETKSTKPGKISRPKTAKNLDKVAT